MSLDDDTVFDKSFPKGCFNFSKQRFEKVKQRKKKLTLDVRKLTLEDKKLKQRVSVQKINLLRIDTILNKFEVYLISIKINVCTYRQGSFKTLIRFKPYD